MDMKKSSQLKDKAFGSNLSILQDVLVFIKKNVVLRNMVYW